MLVHGLTGDCEKTWTHPRTGVFWPESLLPREFPKARIMTYGYDADIVHLLGSSSSNTLRDHGRSLAIDFASKRRRTKSNDRPIIFVAHSLGGLVCQQALLISRGAAEPYLQAVLECTKAIAFMGTPHAGSDLTRWGQILTGLSALVKKTNKEIVNVLNPGSEVLANLQQEFHIMIESRHRALKPSIDMFCFYEELNTSGLGAIVEKRSAILPRYQCRGIHANHVDMTKFEDEKDDGYQFVVDQVSGWVSELEEDSRCLRPIGSELAPRNVPP